MEELQQTKPISKSLRIKRIVFSMAIVLLVTLFDQISKALVTSYLKPIREVRLWDGVLHFRYHENRGAAFGMLADHRWVFLVISTVAILAIVGYLWYAKSVPTLLSVGLAMVAGGGIGNMIDRVAYGYVVDFIYAACIDFAIFNVADSFVCVGAALVCFAVLRSEIREWKRSRAKESGRDHDGN